MTYEPSTMTTIDGRQVLSNSEAWRSVCEAVQVLNMGPRARSAWLDVVERRRGQSGRQYLDDEMALIEPAFVLALPDKDARNKYLDEVQDRLGETARDALQARVVELWNQRKAVPAVAAQT
jgi:hypothetical protein